MTWVDALKICLNLALVVLYGVLVWLFYRDKQDRKRCSK